MMALFLLVLAGVLFAALWSVGEASREKAAMQQISEICARLRSGEEGVIDSPPLDPWKRPYLITADDREIRVRCGGPDGLFGSDDDVAAVLDRRTGRRVFLGRCVND